MEQGLLILETFARVGEFAFIVIPAKAGIQLSQRLVWMPACAGMTKKIRANVSMLSLSKHEPAEA